MLLSFSVPEMLPMLRAGLAQCRGEDVGTKRVKRQTIRQYGPRAERLLAHDPIGHTIPYDLHLWWKSRTPDRALIGTIPCGIPPVRVYRLDIWHTSIKPVGEPAYPCIRIDGPRGWRNGDAMLFWSPNHGGHLFEQETRADGFDSAEAFRDFFVPNPGDRFDAILFKW